MKLNNLTWKLFPKVFNNGSQGLKIRERSPRLSYGILQIQQNINNFSMILKIFNYNFIYDFHTIYKKLMIKLYSQKKILWILMFYQVGSNFLMYLTQMRILNLRNFFKVQTNKKNYCVSNMRTLNYCFSALILFQLTIKRQNSIKFDRIRQNKKNRRKKA